VTTPASNITVLVVDDQRLVRAGFQVILDLEPDITVVGEAGDGYEAITLAARLSPTVVLMDVRMPGMDGLAAARAIVAGTSSRVLMLTTFDSDEYVYTALRAGASGFLLKDTPSQHLVTAVRPSTTAPEQLAALTPREREVLRLIAQGLSNAEIAQELTVEENTVKTHVGRVLTKLGLRDRVQAVVLAYETGFVVPDLPPS
jgi:DNA-binding NarL/FixJ family response regulator